MRISSCSKVNTSLPSSQHWVQVGNLLIVNQKQVREYRFTAEKSQLNSGRFASANEEQDSRLLAHSRPATSHALH